MVILPNIDGKIWNIEYAIVKIVNNLETTGRVSISLNGEGPCANSLGLYALLDDLCAKRNYNKSCITIQTNNLLEYHSEYRVNIAGPLYLDSVQQFSKSNQFPKKDFNNLKYFGLFVGRSNWIRLWISSHVLQNYRDRSLMTFHYNPKSDFHRDHLGVDTSLMHAPDHVDLHAMIDLIKQCPITLESSLPEYPIITPAHFKIAKVYHQFFVEIVCETYSQGNTFYPTEKIWRPIALKTPFIVQGPRHYYKHLHKMGFKTFNNWWDEGFTYDDFTYQPVEIFKILDQLSKLTTEDLEALYIDMQSTLDHNYDLLMTLKPEHFKRVFNDQR